MIYLGSDHRGLHLKEIVRDYLEELDYEYQDLGAFELDETDDYTNFAEKVASRIIDSDDRGIVICGSGVGVDVVANKHDGVRSGLALNIEQVKAARHDDDINVLALASDHTGEDDVKKIVSVFLETDFAGEERHKRRLHDIEELEEIN